MMNDNDRFDRSIPGGIQEGQGITGGWRREGDGGIRNGRAYSHNIIRRVVRSHGENVVSGGICERCALIRDTTGLSNGVNRRNSINIRKVVDNIEIMTFFVIGEPGVRVVVKGLGGGPYVSAIDNCLADYSPALVGRGFHNEIIRVTGDGDGTDRASRSRGTTDGENVVV